MGLKSLFVDDSLQRLVDEFTGREWSDDLEADWETRLLEEHIPHKFNTADYLEAGKWMEKWLPLYFDMPKSPWNWEGDERFNGHIEGAGHVKPLIGKKNAKLVYVVYPHNSHTDSPLFPITLWLNGLGDVRTFARSNMFKLKKLAGTLRTGAFIGSYHEQMPEHMFRSAMNARDRYLEDTLLPEANVLNHDEATGLDTYGNLHLFGTNGRSRDGHIMELSEGIIGTFMRMQHKHPEWQIYIVPVVNTMLMAPEEDALPNLKKGNIVSYLMNDYGAILKKIMMQKTNKFRVPRSDFYYDMLKPIPVWDYAVDPSNEHQFEERKAEFKDLLQGMLKINYRILPEKLVANVILNDLGNSDEISHGELQDRVIRKYHFYQKYNLNLTAPEGDHHNIIDKAVDFYAGNGTLALQNGMVKVLRPERIRYQANTIAHISKDLR